MLGMLVDHGDELLCRVLSRAAPVKAKGFGCSDFVIDIQLKYVQVGNGRSASTGGIGDVTRLPQAASNRAPLSS
jgi:hypothetical protein